MDDSLILWAHLGEGLHRADVRVWTEENVLQLGLLLVHPLHRQLGARLVFLGPFHLGAVSSAIRSLLSSRSVLVNNAETTWTKTCSKMPPTTDYEWSRL